jgi:hypothetical protein
MTKSEIGDISLDTATGSEHGYCLLLPPTVTLSAPVSTVGNAVMGSVSKLVKVGDLNNLILNLVTWNQCCSISILSDRDMCAVQAKGTVGVGIVPRIGVGTVPRVGMGTVSRIGVVYR